MYTPLKINRLDPENHPIEKDNYLPKPGFLGAKAIHFQEGVKGVPTRTSPKKPEQIKVIFFPAS